MNKEQINEIALRVGRELFGCERPADVAYAHALLEAIQGEAVPFGYYENGRFSVNIDGGPDKWRERKTYRGALYTAPPAAPAVPESLFEDAKQIFCSDSEPNTNGNCFDVIEWFKASLAVLSTSPSEVK